MRSGGSRKEIELNGMKGRRAIWENR